MNLGYYQVIVQVLPTLLIAVLIEMRSIFDLSVRIAAAEEDLEFVKEPRPTREITTSVLPSAARSYALFALTSVLFFLGEVTALIVVWMGPEGWVPWLAGPTSALATVGLIVLAVALPFQHMGYRAWLVSVERDLRRLIRERDLPMTEVPEGGSTLSGKASV